jgi:hypothetical protein
MEDEIDMADPLDLIEQGCYLAFRLMLRASVTPTGSLETTHGCYGFRQGATAYHPLEAVLVGEDARSGGWKVDAADRLGVSFEWVEGFLAGFAQAGENSTGPDFIQGYLTAEELRQRRPSLFKPWRDEGTAPSSSQGVQFRTYLDTLKQLPPWGRGACVNEAMLTHFVAPVPDDLSLLRGGLADLGFDNLDLPPQEQNKMLLAFVGRGVRVPGTPYRLRNWGIRSFVEAADGSEEAALPENWKQALLVPARNHDGFTWIGKRVPKNKIGNVDFNQYADAGEGWMPLTNSPPRRPPAPAGGNGRC